MSDAPQNLLASIGLQSSGPVHFQLSPEELTQQSVDRKEGVLNDTGALVIKTGKYTGRSPKDRFIVKDEITADTVNWNDFNLPIEEKYFLQLKEKMMLYLSDKSIWVRDCIACAEEKYQLKLRVVNEDPASNLFCYNMFIRPNKAQLNDFTPDWHLIQAPGCKADPGVYGTRQDKFAILSVIHKTILIGST